MVTMHPGCECFATTTAAHIGAGRTTDWKELGAAWPLLFEILLFLILMGCLGEWTQTWWRRITTLCRCVEPATVVGRKGEQLMLRQVVEMITCVMPGCQECFRLSAIIVYDRPRLHWCTLFWWRTKPPKVICGAISDTLGSIMSFKRCERAITEVQHRDAVTPIRNVGAPVAEISWLFERPETLFEQNRGAGSPSDDENAWMAGDRWADSNRVTVSVGKHRRALIDNNSDFVYYTIKDRSEGSNRPVPPTRLGTMGGTFHFAGVQIMNNQTVFPAGDRPTWLFFSMVSEDTITTSLLNRCWRMAITRWLPFDTREKVCAQSRDDLAGQIESVAVMNRNGDCLLTVRRGTSGNHRRRKTHRCAASRKIAILWKWRHRMDRTNFQQLPLSLLPWENVAQRAARLKTQHYHIYVFHRWWLYQANMRRAGSGIPHCPIVVQTSGERRWH